jgi:hypothetical protein
MDDKDDNPNLFTMWLARLAVAGGSYALLVWLVGGFTFILAIPIFGVALAKPIIESFSWFSNTVKSRAYAGLNGCYYSFDGWPVGVAETGDQRLALVPLKDMCKVLGIALDRQLSRSVEISYGGAATQLAGGQIALPIAEAIRFVSARDSADAKRFRLWLERDVQFPLRRRWDIANGR